MTILQMTSATGVAGVVAKGTLLLAIGWCGTLLLRRAPAVARHLVWLTVIVGLLLIPVLARLAPMNLPVLPSVSAAPGASASRDSRSAEVVAVTKGTAVEPSVVANASRKGVGSGPNYGSLAVALWFIVAAALVARLMAGMLSVGRIIRRGRSLHSAEWMRALADAASRLKLAEPPRLVVSDQVEMAFAFDAFAPTIIVPVSAQEWSDDRRRAVLLHELAHIRRRDLIGHTIASIACAVYWFNPFVWAAARRLRVESELASDDVVLDSGVRASDYAQHLLDMVTSLGGRAPTVALAMARPKEFEGRLVAILDRSNRRKVLGRTQRGAMVGLLGLLTVSIAAVVPVPRSNPVVATPPSTVAMPRADSAAVSTAARAEVPRPKAASRTDAPAALSDAAIATLLRFGTAGIINPMMMILRDANTLELTGTQADSIATLNRWYMVRLNAIWSPVSSYYVSHPRMSGQVETSIDPTLRRAPQASMELLIGIVPDITGLLTAEQRGKLRPTVSAYLDARNLAAIGAGQTRTPSGVFLENSELFGGGGRRGGGGRGRGPA